SGRGIKSSACEQLDSESGLLGLIPRQLEKLGGQTVTMECTFSTGYQNYYLFWYRQQRSGAMDFLFRTDESNDEKNGAGRRFSAEFRKSFKFFSLTIKELEPTDSAIYFFALWEDTVRRLIGIPVQNPPPGLSHHEKHNCRVESPGPDRWLNQMMGLINVSLPTVGLLLIPEPSPAVHPPERSKGEHVQ
uniref:Ig-like domain-containing protein n=1 Tax=Terrapene triunguis TaxID=2587831 RepID=A0A674IG05_9SAUR